MTLEANNIVRLPPESGIKAAGQIAEILRSAFGEPGSLGIDTSSVSNADMTTVQLLLAARKQALASGKLLFLLSPPTGRLREVLTAIGCTSEAGDTHSPDDGFWNPVATAAADHAA